MDHRGLRERLTGAGCASCGAAIPVDRIAVLADRGDLAFVELACPRCGSRTMGVVIANDVGSPVLDTAADARLAGRPPIDRVDVVAMRRFLAGWHGDLRSLLEPPDTAAGRGGAA
jgi:DNA-directed RNA polymerase subunit RPC12/RpoP